MDSIEMSLVESLLSFAANEWIALGTMIYGVATLILAVGVVIAGFWALFNYRKSRRIAAARWVHDLYNQFYFEERFSQVLSLIEYKLDDSLAHLLERRITDRHLPINDDEIDLLRKIDTFLNYFEFLLYIEQEGHLSKKDREALFSYWFQLIKSTKSASIRRYIARFGFEELAKEVGSDLQRCEYIAFYGTLMKHHDSIEHLGITDQICYEGPCKIGGTLYDLGEYPGLIINDDSNTVTGDLYKIKDLSVFQKLDEFERYYPDKHKTSLYVRRCIRITEPSKDSWIYLYNGDVLDKKKISNSSWKE